MELIKLTEQEFADFRATIRCGSFLQTAEMGQLMQDCGWQVTYLGVRIGREIRLAGLLASKKMTGGWHFELQYGPVYQVYDAVIEQFFYEALRSYVKKHEGLELLLTPNVTVQTFSSDGTALSPQNTELIGRLAKLKYQHTGLKSGYHRCEATWHFVKELQEVSDEADLLRSYNSNARRNLKKALANGLSVRAVAENELLAVADLIEKSGETHHFVTHSLIYYQKLAKAFGEKVEFLLVEKGEEKQAAGVFIQNGAEYVYLYGGSDKAYSRQGGPFLLHHTALLHALEKGCTLYNFYGVSGKMDGSDGVLRFKQNFGGLVQQKIGYFYYYPRPMRHRMIQMAKHLLGRK